jgi:hypothetical protein
MVERGNFSRKELGGWGDSSFKIDNTLIVEDLANRVDPILIEQYKHEMSETIDIILAGLHLENHTVIQRKYNMVEEDTIFVYEYLKNILMKRAMKKLSSLLV